MDLNKILQTKNYQINWFPKNDDTFRYVVIDNIFKDSFKQKLNNYYQLKLDNDEFTPFQFYDSDVLTIDPREKNNPFDFVYSLEWKEFISNMFPDIPITNNVVSELQHHDVGTNDGWIHNDFDAAHFVHEPLDNGINPWYFQCDYRQEKPTEDLITNVRSIVVMYHINDKFTYEETVKYDWEEGDGGETGFYDDINSDVGYPTLKINPYPNRLVVYEINPWSFHTFISNRKHIRGTMNLWYHSTIEETMNEYGWTGKNLYKSIETFKSVSNKK